MATSSPVTVLITSGPVMNMWLVLSTMTVKSVTAGEYTAPPAQGPITREICGMTPEAWTLRRKISPYNPRETTPSWIRAPPESLSPMTGQPTFIAKSMTLQIFSPNTSPNDPPKTVKSCANTATVRPSTVPYPVTTPSPYGRLASAPNATERCRAYLSISTNDPSSSSNASRSRAVPLPRACCFSTARSEPACATCATRRFRSASFPAVVEVSRSAGTSVPPMDCESLVDMRRA